MRLLVSVLVPFLRGLIATLGLRLRGEGMGHDLELAYTCPYSLNSGRVTCLWWRRVFTVNAVSLGLYPALGHSTCGEGTMGSIIRPPGSAGSVALSSGFWGFLAPRLLA